MGTQMESRRGPMLSLMPVNMEVPEANRSHSGSGISFHHESTGSDNPMGTTITSRHWRDRRRLIAGKVLAACANQQKAIAHAQDWTEGWVSKLTNGNASADSYLRVVDRMQRHSKTEAGPLAAAPLAEMARVVAETYSDLELEAAEDELLALEQERAARDNEVIMRLLLAARRGDATPAQLAEIEEELAMRHVEEVSVSLLLLAVLWERQRRRAERVH